MQAAGLPELRYPTRLNAAVELLDAMVERVFGSYPCLRAPDETWTYAQLLERANRIANLLVTEGMVPGERVLLRDANSPMMAACWLAVDATRSIVEPHRPTVESGRIPGKGT